MEISSPADPASQEVSSSPLATSMKCVEETVLSSQESREELINNLTESEFFINQRLYELQSKEQSTFEAYENTNKAQILKSYDNIEYFQGLLKVVQDTNQLLCSKETYMLLQIKFNSKCLLNSYIIEQHAKEL